MEISKVVGVFVIGTLLALSLAFVSITVTRMTDIKHYESRQWGSWASNLSRVQSSINVYTVSLQPQVLFASAPQANMSALSGALQMTTGELSAHVPYSPAQYSYTLTSNSVVYTVFNWQGRLDIRSLSIYLKNVTVVAPYGLWVTHSWVNEVEDDRMVVYTSVSPNSTLVVNIITPSSSNITAFSIPGYLDLENYTVSVDNGETMVSFVYKVGEENNVLIILPFLFENTSLYYVIYVM